MCYFSLLMPGHWGPDNPAGEALVTNPSCGLAFQNGRLHFRMAPSPDLHCEGLAEVPAVNSQNCAPTPNAWVPDPWELELSELSTWSIQQLWVPSCSPSPSPASLRDLSSGKLWVSPIWGQQFALWPHFSNRLKKSCWYFHFHFFTY